VGPPTKEVTMAVDPFMLLEFDHRQVETMLEELEKSEPGPEREQLVQQLARSFEAHAQFEERAVYPLVVDVMDAETEQEAEVEHGLAREGVQKLVAMASEPGFGAAVEMLTGGIGHHVKDEENEIFPQLRQALTDDTKAQLASRLLAAKAEAGLPVVDPAVATKEQMVKAAEALGIEGRSSMTKEQLAEALAR
jgi:hemerythrin superfamily protein